jgi:hypothetical protein
MLLIGAIRDVMASKYAYTWGILASFIWSKFSDLRLSVLLFTFMIAHPSEKAQKLFVAIGKEVKSVSATLS